MHSKGIDPNNMPGEYHPKNKEKSDSDVILKPQSHRVTSKVRPREEGIVEESQKVPTTGRG